jgi:hypothetical protein
MAADYDALRAKAFELAMPAIDAAEACERLDRH